MSDFKLKREDCPHHNTEKERSPFGEGTTGDMLCLDCGDTWRRDDVAYLPQARKELAERLKSSLGGSRCLHTGTLIEVSDGGIIGTGEYRCTKCGRYGIGPEWPKTDPEGNEFSQTT